MAYNKSVVAAGLVVGVAAVAGILKLKFYYYPPEDHFTASIDALLDRQATLLDEATDTFSTATKPAVTSTAVTTVQDDHAIYAVIGTNVDLAVGVPLAVLSQADEVLVASLRGSNLYLLAYDASWQLRDGGEYLLQTDIALVQGQPPVAVLTATATGYRVIIQTATDVRLITLDQQFAVQHIGSIIAQPQVAAATAETLWLYNRTGHLQIYDLNPTTLLAEQAMDPVVCSLIAGQTSVVAVQSNLANQLTFTKLNTVGSESAVVATLPSKLTSLGNCSASARTAGLLALLQDSSIILLSEDLTTQYPSMVLPAGGLFTQLGFSEQALWVLYSTSETLGEYTMHVASYARLPATE